MIDWLPPTRFDDYELISELGRGAMGQVHLAMDLQLQREVAIKFILRSDEFGDVAQQRFLLEARAIARLQGHPNVVTVHRVGQVDGHLFQVSEYVRGTPLDQLGDRTEGKGISQAQAFEIALDIASGLAAAHRAQVIHRDVKPANAIWTDEGRVKLLDFGIAKVVVGGLSPHATPTPAVGLPARLSESGQRVVDPYATTGDDAGQGLAEAMTHMKATGALDPLGDTGSPVDAMAETRLHTLPEPAAQRTPVIHSTGGGVPEAGQSGNAVIKTGSSHLRAIQDVERQKLGAGSAAKITKHGEVIGTPLYMAPEAWNGQDVDYTADVYSFGALMYELCTGHPPYEGKGIAGLWKAVLHAEYVPLSKAAVHIEPRFAAIIDRCLSRDPTQRYASADWLRAELDGLGKREGGPVPSDPYRGLEVFEAEHRGVFFGRDGERRQLLDRLSVDSLVVVAGDSGTGKSSLCRAGVLPHLAHRLAGDRAWEVVHLVPGSHPLNALCACLAGVLDEDESDLVVAIETDPRDFARLVRARLGHDRGLVLFIDQFEELATLAQVDEAQAVAEALSWLATRAPALRVLVTVRADFLGRVAELPMIGEAIARSLYFLRPLSPERIREITQSPAQAKGFRFETDAMVDELVESTVSAGSGGLPLLQFALAELWKKRDKRRNVIPAEALASIGGVAGALSRHADRVVRSLTPSQLERAKYLLTQLVTEEGTRARCTADELGLEAPDAAEVLEILLKNRLLAQNDQIIEIAHEALVRAWGTLSDWLNADVDLRLAMQRLRRSVREWVASDRGGAWLWRADQLRLAELLAGQSLTAEEAAFLAASWRLKRRNRVRVVSAVILTVVMAAGGFVYRSVLAEQEVQARVDDHLNNGTQSAEMAQKALEQGLAFRETALRQFDTGKGEAAEKTWDLWQAQASLARPHLARADRELRAARAWDRDRPDVREALVKVVLRRIRLAELSGDREQRTEFFEQLKLYDAAQAEALTAPAELVLDVAPSAAELTVRQVIPGTQRRTLARMPAADLRVLPPGSYVIEANAPGYVRTRTAVTLAPGGRREVGFTLPKADRVPDGYVYIPPGRSPVGSWMNDELRRGFERAVPFHEVETGGYLIGRTEVTVGAWLDYLDALEPTAREAAMVDLKHKVEGFTGGISLERVEGRWVYHFKSWASDDRGVLRYGATKGARSFPMRALPLTGVKLERFRGFLRWLDASGRLPGARLCTDHEWERAARAADDRLFPQGDQLAPSQANIDKTYDKSIRGPDAVGSHPDSISPFGLQDMAGNAYEWVSRTDGEDYEVRSGAFTFSANTARIAASEHLESDFSGPDVGFRVCADFDAGAAAGRPPREP